MVGVAERKRRRLDRRPDLAARPAVGATAGDRCAGKRSDHLLTRSSSRRRYGDLLKAGVEVYEYRPAMIHAKIMVIDCLWSVIGSTNLDNRSFGLNDEVNVALRNPDLAARLETDLREDLETSNRMTYDRWLHRPIKERVIEWMFRMFDRQF